MPRGNATKYIIDENVARNNNYGLYNSMPHRICHKININHVQYKNLLIKVPQIYKISIISHTIQNIKIISQKIQSL